MLLFRTVDGVQRHCAVQSYKSALMFYGQGQQILIIELPVAVDFAVVKHRCVEQAHVIWPELIVRRLTKILQGFNYLHQRQLVAIAGLTHNSYTAILR